MDAVVDLVGGAAIGVAIGLAGAVLFRIAAGRGWSAPAFRPLAPLGLALVAYGATVLLSANGFVAAFVAGMAFGSILPAELETTVDFTSVVGELLSLVMWFLVGAAMLVPALDHARWQDAVFAILALTVVRMVPVAIACLGLGLERRTVVFIGWFGPRGLASIIFALLAFESLDSPDDDRVLAAVVITVVVSVVAHGMTASPLAARYGAAVAASRPHGPEHVATPELKPRSPVRRPPVAGEDPREP
jgi:NhaP-type Na+/H+ or K+/H+ antiporter